ncbi:MAG TPA: hybrid sensor histidine kinase/response regulator [Burkholderiales bacterium]|nr:hybrid sensor histidine kinase/response regulator [Burkholderiales bacterium]
MSRGKGGFDSAILYVDDEEIAGKYFARAFAADYRVITASSTDEAIGILRERHVDILVTDYRMPGRSGGELLRIVAEEFPYVVRILVTAFADRDVLLDAVNSGEIFRILEKPYDFDNVRKTLRMASELSSERNTRRQRLQAIEETLGFLAHELNTPLATIVNYVRGMEQRMADMPARQQKEMSKALTAMNDNASYCLTLLSSFVESVHDAGAELFHPAGTTAGQMISSLLDTYPLVHAQRAQIHVDIREDFPVLAAPNCVLLVLSSILGNALRAVQHHPLPMVRFMVLVEENPQIRIVDNGPGIPPQILEHLLHDPVTTHAGEGGKGWGLIFCNRIMQSFGGGIMAHSTPGSPTVFTLNFPVIKRSDQ